MPPVTICSFPDCKAALHEHLPPFEQTLHCGVCRRFHCCKSCYTSDLRLPRRRRTRDAREEDDSSDEDDEDAGTEFRGWDHALGAFTCYECQVAAQTGRPFDASSSIDDTLGRLERQRQLDVAHHTADSTAYGYLLHIRRTLRWQRSFGVVAITTYPSVIPVHGNASVTVAWHVLTRSLDPGRDGNCLSAGTLAKIRSAISCAHNDTTSLSSGGLTQKIRLPLAPTLSNQYEWFVKGLERRIGTDSEQAYVFSFAAFLAVIDDVESDYQAAAGARFSDVPGSKAWATLWDHTFEGLFWHLAFFGGFRGGEAFRVSWDQLLRDQQLDPAIKEPYLKLVIKRTKNSQTSKVDVFVAATSRHSSASTRRWFLRAAAIRPQASVARPDFHAKKVFTSPAGKTWSTTNTLNSRVRPRLSVVQARSSNLLPANINVDTEVTSNSFRRSAATAMQAAGTVLIPTHIVDGHCRWKLEAHMRDYYSQIQISEKLRATLYMCDAQILEQRPASPASGPLAAAALPATSHGRRRRRRLFSSSDSESD